MLSYMEFLRSSVIHN